MDNSAKKSELNIAALIMNICQTFLHLEGNHFSFCRFHKIIGQITSEIKNNMSDKSFNSPKKN